MYKHVFSINAAPTLAFIGLPFKVKLPNPQLHLQYSIQSLLTTAAMQVVPFPQMELVAKWIARVLSGRSQLPTMMAMRQDSRSHYEHLRMQGMPVRWGHPVRAICSHMFLLRQQSTCHASSTGPLGETH